MARLGHRPDARRHHFMESPLLSFLVLGLGLLCFALFAESKVDMIPRPLPSPPSHSPFSPPTLSTSTASRQRTQPPPRKNPNRSPPPKITSSSFLRPEERHVTPTRNAAPARKKRKPNLGKTIGWMFVGFAGIMQVCVVAFLLIKRNQLFRDAGSF